MSADRERIEATARGLHDWGETFRHISGQWVPKRAWGQRTEADKAWFRALAAEAERIAREREAPLREALEKMRRPHYACEDSFYSCPKTGECSDDHAGNECNCGADIANAEIDRALSGSGTDRAGCKARNANMGANDPQDCDWPFCDCDPAANRVIAGLQEAGLQIVRLDAHAGGGGDG